MLDELARTENLSVNQAELSYFVADQAQRMGISPEYFAQQLIENNQINVAITEVLRGKAATIVAERVTVTDEAGNAIDVKAQIEELNADVDAMLAAQAAAEGATDIEVNDLSIDVAGTIEAEAEADETEVVSRPSPRPRPRRRSSTRPRTSSRTPKPTRTKKRTTTGTKESPDLPDLAGPGLSPWAMLLCRKAATRCAESEQRGTADSVAPHWR